MAAEDGRLAKSTYAPFIAALNFDGCVCLYWTLDIRPKESLGRILYPGRLLGKAPLCQSVYFLTYG